MELSTERKAMEKPCLSVIQNFKKLQLGAWGPPQGRPNPELNNLATYTYCFEQKCNDLTNIKGIQGGRWSWDHGVSTVYTYIHDYTRETLCYDCSCFITPRTLAIQLWRGASHGGRMGITDSHQLLQKEQNQVDLNSRQDWDAAARGFQPTEWTSLD